MKSSLSYIKEQIIPPLSFLLFLAVEGILLYGLYHALIGR